MESYMLPCLWLKITGIPCPGCGGQRSVVHLLHGEFTEAFFMYPAIYPLLLLGALIGLNRLVAFKQYSQWVSATAILSVAVVFISYFLKLNGIFHFFT